mgnify:CR=1 FL=1
MFLWEVHSYLDLLDKINKKLHPDINIICFESNQIFFRNKKKFLSKENLIAFERNFLFLFLAT